MTMRAINKSSKEELIAAAMLPITKNTSVHRMTRRRSHSPVSVARIGVPTRIGERKGGDQRAGERNGDAGVGRDVGQQTGNDEAFGRDRERPERKPEETFVHDIVLSSKVIEQLDLTRHDVNEARRK